MNNEIRAPPCCPVAVGRPGILAVVAVASLLLLPGCLFGRDDLEVAVTNATVHPIDGTITILFQDGTGQRLSESIDLHVDAAPDGHGQPVYVYRNRDVPGGPGDLTFTVALTNGTRATHTFPQWGSGDVNWVGITLRPDAVTITGAFAD